jgi:hypothetical protein
MQRTEYFSLLPLIYFVQIICETIFLSITESFHITHLIPLAEQTGFISSLSNLISEYLWFRTMSGLLIFLFPMAILEKFILKNFKNAYFKLAILNIVLNIDWIISVNFIHWHNEQLLPKLIATIFSASIVSFWLIKTKPFSKDLFGK